MGGKLGRPSRMAGGRLEWCTSPASVMRLANSLPMKSAGLMEQLSISLLCNIWRVFVWALSHWLACWNFRITPHRGKVHYGTALHNIA